MKIAYIVDGDISQETGVIRKIKSKISLWEEFGHEVCVYALRSDNNGSVIDSGIIVYKSVEGRSLTRKLVRQYKMSSALDRSLIKFKPDLIYTRYVKYYPGMVKILKKYAPFVVEINTNDVEEQKTYRRGRISYIYNLLTRNILLKNASGFVSVSTELINDQIFSKFSKPAIVIGNGYDYKSVKSKKKVFNKNLEIVFIGTPRQKWHGLDKIVYLANKLPENKFHIIGPSIDDLSEFDLKIEENVIFHGYLDQIKLERIVSQCDVGVSTLALHRNNMNEASSLKSRQYLAHGLPIIIGYRDTDLPDDLDFYLNIGNYENNVKDHLKEIKQFMDQISGLDPEQIIKDSKKYLDQRDKEVLRLKFMETMSNRHKSGL